MYKTLNTKIIENAKSFSLSFSIIFTVIVFRFFSLPLPFPFRPKNQKKLENDFRKSEIIIFGFITSHDGGWRQPACGSSLSGHGQRQLGCVCAAATWSATVRAVLPAGRPSQLSPPWRRPSVLLRRLSGRLVHSLVPTTLPLAVSVSSETMERKMRWRLQARSPGSEI